MARPNVDTRGKRRHRCIPIPRNPRGSSRRKRASVQSTRLIGWLQVVVVVAQEMFPGAAHHRDVIYPLRVLRHSTTTTSKANGSVFDVGLQRRRCRPQRFTFKLLLHKLMP